MRCIISWLSAQQLIAISLLSLVACTMGILSLPYVYCQPIALNFIDLFFISVSFVTTTGFEIIPLTSFNTLGHIVIFVLMQIAGIGFITLSLYCLSLFIKLGKETQLLGAQVLSLSSWRTTRKFIIFVVSFSFFIQTLGTFALWITLICDHSWYDALFLSIFHSASAFSSAGLILLKHNLDYYSHNYVLLISLSALMFIGELGFIVWYDYYNWIRCKIRSRPCSINFYTKVILYSTLLISCIGFILYILLQQSNFDSSASSIHRIVTALFSSIAARGTGFCLVSVSSMHSSIIMLIMLLCFIGSSPGSTGSGIKTTSLVLIASCIKTAVTGRTLNTLNARTVGTEQSCQAISIVCLSISWIILALFFLLLIESSSFIHLLFEVVSAFGNCGLSMGITKNLSAAGKVIIGLTMIAGRLGCLNIFIALLRSVEHKHASAHNQKIIL